MLTVGRQQTYHGGKRKMIRTQKQNTQNNKVLQQQRWENVRERLRAAYGEAIFNSWLAPLRLADIKNGQVMITVPTRFMREWILAHYIDNILRFWTNEDRTIHCVDIFVRPEAPASFQSRDQIVSTLPETAMPFVQPQNDSDNQTQADDNGQVGAPLDPRYTFENFVVGKPNELAHAAARRVAEVENVVEGCNPLFLYGGVGLGKTHLAHAIGVDIKDKYPEKTVLYISAEKFTQQYIDAVKKNNRNDFIHFYQLIDVLIIDDVQFLSGKSGTQDVFFHIFNHLHQNGKQVVLTSDKAPVDMQDIEQRLLSRFKWGLSAELQNPDFETRVSILNNKLYRDGVEMPEDIVEYVAKNIKTNVRELEGAIISLIAQASFNKKEITLSLAKDIVEKFVKNTKREVSIDYIQKVVSDYFQMDVETLQSKTRKRHIVQARQLAMFFAKKFTKASLASIGSQIGKRDHATVLHACKTVDNLSSTDKQFRKYVEDLSKKLSL